MTEVRIAVCLEDLLPGLIVNTFVLFGPLDHACSGQYGRVSSGESILI
jgi:hypothetical protein